MRAKLGKPDSSDGRSDLFEVAKNETAIVYYDDDHKARAVVVTYNGGGAPTPLEVFGEEAPPGADGGVSKMVRYDDQGFWVSYNKIAGDNPAVIVTIRKIK